MRDDDGTLLCAHPVPGRECCFYLWYRPGPAEEPVTLILGCRDDAAVFVMGLAGPELRGLTEQERHRVREYFPGWFRGG
jgi:hypothetical protein